MTFVREHADSNGHIVLRGGLVHDPLDGTVSERDLRLADGVFSSLPAQPGDRIIDVSGHIVTAGLLDLHTHVFSGQDAGVSADETAFPTGVTTMIDAGSAGADLFGAFRRSAVERSRVRIRAFLNIATIGTTSIHLGGELRAPWYVSEESALNALAEHRDLLVGIKVRASADVGGENSPAALAAARRVADEAGVPLMVHLGPAPSRIDDTLAALGEGDILTHAYSGWTGNMVIDDDGRVRESVVAARERGVIIDIGHGQTGFSLDVARRMLEQGHAPDVISTDIHARARETVIDQLTVMSKFLALGMPLIDVLRAATVTPARVVGLPVGVLTPGAPADVCVLERVTGRVEFGDGFGGSATGDERLRAKLTFLAGEVVYDGGAT